MSFELSLSQAAVKYGGTLVAPDCHFNDVSIDSRTIKAGELFVAIKGEQFDGHEFLSNVQTTACGAVVQKYVREVAIPQWVVPDTTKALGQLAAIKRAKFTGPVIAITGSSGKTTVKEMVDSILQQKGAVISTRGNLNNQLGVPLTLFALRPRHQFSVVEMGASAAGDIAYLCAIATPDVAVVNNVLPAHIAGFGSVDAIARAKGEIYESLNGAGIAVVNLDEQYRNDWTSSCAAEKVVTFSINEAADFTARQIEKDSNGHYSFVMVMPKGSARINLSMPGKHNISNALAAAACAYAVGANAEQISAGIHQMKTISGRMQRLVGSNGAAVIDDSYNANPGSMSAAIDALCDINGQKILVVGDMAELGKDAAVIHGETGRYAKRAGVEKLFAVGRLSFETAYEFGQGGQHFKSKDELIAALSGALNGETVVLVKGSRSAGMEDIVNAITQKEAT